MVVFIDQRFLDKLTFIRKKERWSGDDDDDDDVGDVVLEVVEL